jgi:hypothetical protein
MHCFFAFQFFLKYLTNFRIISFYYLILPGMYKLQQEYIYVNCIVFIMEGYVILQYCCVYKHYNVQL